MKELKKMLATTPILASSLEKEPMMLYIEATNRVVSVVVVVEREQEGKTVQRPLYYLSEVLSLSKKKLPTLPKDEIWRVHGRYEAQALLRGTPNDSGMRGSYLGDHRQQRCKRQDRKMGNSIVTICAAV
jgi:hypothetical protein